MESCLRRARARIGLSLLLQHAAVALLAAGAVAALLVAVERALVPGVATIWTAAGLGAAILLAAAIRWYLALPGRMAAAVMVDERLLLRERVSTALALGDSDEPFALAAREEARRKMQGMHVRKSFPIRLSRRWFYAGGAWLVAAGAFFLMPHDLDLLGYLQRQKQDQQNQDQLADTKDQVRQVAKLVRSSISGIKDKGLSAKLAELDKIEVAAQAPDVLRNEAIKKLSDISDRIKEKLAGDKLGGAEGTKKILEDLRGTREPLSRELSRALAKGQFDKAAKLVQQMQQKLAEGGLSDAECKALSEQLGQLAKQIEDLSDQDKQAEKLLAQEGLDKSMAGMSKDDLAKALKDRGWSDQQIQDLMDKLSKMSQAASDCQNLADAMAGACDGAAMTPEELADLLDQLQDMASLEGELSQCQGSLEDIEAMIAALGDKAGTRAWREGLALLPGPGTGGPGRGYGARPEDNTGMTGIEKTRSNTKTGKGPMIASWYFRGPQVKGETKKDFTEVVRSARDHADDAINENKIPSRYAPAVKKYFDTFNKSGGESSE